MRATNTASRWYSPVCAISNTRGQFSPSGPGTVHRWGTVLTFRAEGCSPMGGTVLTFRAGERFTDGRDGSHLPDRRTVRRGGQFSAFGQGGGSPMGDSSHLSGRGLFTDGRDGSHLLGRGTVHRWEGRFSAFGQGNGSPMGGTVLTFRTEGRSAEGDSSQLTDRETYTDGKLPRGKEQDDEDTYCWRRRA